MSKRTLLLIVGLAIVTGGLLFLAFLSEQRKKTTESPLNQTSIPTPTSPAHTTLSLVPNPVIVSSSGSASIDVEMDTQSNDVTAVQLELSYDPKAITNVTISPSNFFTNPIVLLKNINQQDGRISYAFGIPSSNSSKKGKGLIATISFNAVNLFGAPTTISFLPKTLVTAQGISASVLQTATGTQIIFPRKSGTPLPLQQGTKTQ